MRHIHGDAATPVIIRAAKLLRPDHAALGVIFHQEPIPRGRGRLQRIGQHDAAKWTVAGIKSADDVGAACIIDHDLAAHLRSFAAGHAQPLVIARRRQTRARHQNQPRHNHSILTHHQRYPLFHKGPHPRPQLNAHRRPDARDFQIA